MENSKPWWKLGFLLSILSAILATYWVPITNELTNSFSFDELHNKHRMLDIQHNSRSFSPIFLSNPAFCKATFNVISEEQQHIKTIMEQNPIGNQVFISRNGANVGRLFSWSSEELFQHQPEACFAALADFAAKVLGANVLDQELDKRFYNSMGEPLRSKGNAFILYLLYDQEVWVWPGIEVGHRWEVDGILMETQSITPRVILVHDVISDVECNLLIDAGNGKLSASPSVSPNSSAYPDYRTSSTAFITDAAVSQVVAKRSQRVSRLPELSFVENLQLVRYSVGQWFKKHTDYFDHFDLATELKDGLADSDIKMWVPWIQGKILGTTCDKDCPMEIQPGGRLYPALSASFQSELVKLFLADSTNELHEILNEEWIEWLRVNSEKKASGVLVTLQENYPGSFVFFRKLWEDFAGKTFEFIPQEKFIEPNRHATLFLYLNDVEEGGETVFPKAEAVAGKSSVIREGMPECSEGLAVKPKKRAGALFYCKTPTGENDPDSYHGGCPPVAGIKWGANVFMWNMNAKTGIKLWKF